jgi:hypothetical protein
MMELRVSYISFQHDVILTNGFWARHFLSNGKAKMPLFKDRFTVSFDVETFIAKKPLRPRKRKTWSSITEDFKSTPSIDGVNTAFIQKALLGKSL